MESIRDGCVWRGGAEHRMVAQVFKEAVLMEPAQCASQCRERKGAEILR
jgi:hypothetical protein